MVEPPSPGETRTPEPRIPEPRTLKPGPREDPGAPFHGRLIDAQSGAPVAGAELRIRTPPTLVGDPWAAWSAPGAAPTTTDAEGRFVLSRPRGGASTAQVEAVGYGPATFQLDGFPAGPDRPRVVRLAREASLALTVRTAEGRGGGLVARLTAAPESLAADAGSLAADAGAPVGPGMEWVQAVGLGGRCRLDHLPAGAPLALRIHRGDLPVWVRPRPIVLQPGEERALPIDLLPGATLTGTLRRLDGTPLAGQEIWLAPATSRGPSLMSTPGVLASVTARASTDPGGAFTFEDVAAGDWWVGPAPAIEWRNDLTPRTSPAPQGHWVHLPPGAGTVDLALTAHCGIFLEGIVRAGDGAPLPFARLSVRPLGNAEGVGVGAGPDGRFRAGPLVPGAHELLVVRDTGRASALVRAPARGIELRLSPAGR